MYVPIWIVLHRTARSAKVKKRIHLQNTKQSVAMCTI